MFFLFCNFKTFWKPNLLKLHIFLYNEMFYYFKRSDILSKLNNKGPSVTKTYFRACLIWQSLYHMTKFVNDKFMSALHVYCPTWRCNKCQCDDFLVYNKKRLFYVNDIEISTGDIGAFSHNITYFFNFHRQKALKDSLSIMNIYM